MDVQEPVNVIYQTAEDGLADTVKPRLEIAGADCEKILVIDEMFFVKHFSRKKASEFPVFSKGFSLL